MDARSSLLIQNALRSESRSFLQYVSDAFPWTTADEIATLAKLQALIAEELEAAQGLAQYLMRHKEPLPYLGSYPMSFTTMNFVSLDHLLPLLVKEERRSLAERERDLAQVHDLEAQAILRSIVATKRRHLQTLEEMASAHPQTSSSVPISA